MLKDEEIAKHVKTITDQMKRDESKELASVIDAGAALATHFLTALSHLARANSR